MMCYFYEGSIASSHHVINAWLTNLTFAVHVTMFSFYYGTKRLREDVSYFIYRTYSLNILTFDWQSFDVNRNIKNVNSFFNTWLFRLKIL